MRVCVFNELTLSSKMKIVKETGGWGTLTEGGELGAGIFSKRENEMPPFVRNLGGKTLFRLKFHHFPTTWINGSMDVAII